MRPYLGWARKIAWLYLLFLVGNFVFAIASVKSETLAFYERKMNPPTFVFWQNGKLFSNPPLFSNLMADTEGELSSREPNEAEDIDIWVLLLEGFEDIKNVEFASQLGVNVKEVATSERGAFTSLDDVSLRVRIYPIPFYVIRKHILILDAKFLRENYKIECLDEIVYGRMIGQPDQELLERCKKT